MSELINILKHLNLKIKCSRYQGFKLQDRTQHKFIQNAWTKKEGEEGRRHGRLGSTTADTGHMQHVTGPKFSKKHHL